MFGFGKKKDAAAPEAQEPEKAGGLRDKRTQLAALGVLVVAGLGYAAYQFLPGLLEEAPPPAPPVAARPKPAPAPAAAAPVAPAPAVAAAPAPKPQPMAKAEPAAKPAPTKPEPMAKPAPKPAPEPMAKSKPAPKPEPMAKSKPMAKPEPEPVAKAEPAPAPKAEPKPAPMAAASAPDPQPPATAPTPAAPPAPASPAMSSIGGPPPVNPKYNDLMTAVLDGDRDAAAQLLDLGRWVDKPDSNGITPLMAAVLAHDHAMVKLLLERGADTTVEAPGGDTAIEFARKNGDGTAERLLLKAAGR